MTQMIRITKLQEKEETEPQLEEMLEIDQTLQCILLQSKTL